MSSPGSVIIQFAVKSAAAARDAAKLATSLGKVDDEASTVDGSLRDAQRAIDKTGTAARDSVRDLGKSETGFDQLGDEADRTADRLRTSAREMAAGVRTGAQDIDSETRRMRGSLADTGKEAGSEFIGNIAEGIGSGQANLTDIVTGTLGGITNLAAGLPGIGTAVAVAAAGVGVLFQKVRGETEKTKEDVSTLIGALEDVGNASSAAAKAIEWQTWLDSFKDAPADLDRIVEGLEQAGISAEVWRDAVVGNRNAQQQVRDKIAASNTAIFKSVDGYTDITEEQQTILNHNKTLLDQLDGQNTKLGTTNEYFNNIDALTDDATDGADQWGNEIADAKEQAKGVNAAMDEAAKPRTVNFTVNVKGGQTMGELLEGIPRTTTAAAPTSRVAEQPVSITVYNQGPAIPNTPRALVDLLETHTVRMGRKPGTPRAVSW